MRKLWLLILVLVAWAAAAAHAVAEPSDLKRHMGDETFEAAGLGSLSPDQLAALERWLQDRGVLPRPPTAEVEGLEKASAPETTVPPPSVSTPAAAPAEVSAAVPAPAGDAEEIRAVIVGPFEGWSGRTYFSLSNGQLWQQRTPGRYSHRAEDVEVRIYKNRLGFQMMEVVATGRSIGVRRVQ
jgi:hypothetical protein